MPTLTDALRAEYQSLFDTCQIDSDQRATVDGIADKIIAARTRYEGVAKPIAVPWVVVGVMHSLEAGLRFDRHLHNGDPLTARTVQVPAGRPKAAPMNGGTVYTWEESADDALRFEKYDSWSDWSVPGILFKWESYNGWGYRQFHPSVKSPYLWGLTNHHTMGKYVADGTWSPTAQTKQLGCAAILRRLAERGAMDAPSFNADPMLAKAVAKDAAALSLQPKRVLPGGVELQQFLNQFPGVFLREDGKLGERTSDAFKKVFGLHLVGDKRG